MNKINLNNKNLTELTEEDLICMCHLKGFKPEELDKLDLNNNYLTNLDFIKENTPFINLETLLIGYNKITDISNIKYIGYLKALNINNLKLNNEYEIIKLLKTKLYLNNLICHNTFKKFNKEQLKQIFFDINVI